jgi:hypothetical protein
MVDKDLKKQILEFCAKYELPFGIRRKQIIESFDLKRGSAWGILKTLVKEEKLLRVGNDHTAKYFVAPQHPKCLTQKDKLKFIVIIFFTQLFYRTQIERLDSLMYDFIEHHSDGKCMSDIHWVAASECVGADNEKCLEWIEALFKEISGKRIKDILNTDMTK